MSAVICSTPQGTACQERERRFRRKVPCRRNKRHCILETEHMPLQPKLFPEVRKVRFCGNRLCRHVAVHILVGADNHKFCNYSMVSLLCRAVPGFLRSEQCSLHCHTMPFFLSALLCYLNKFKKNEKNIAKNEKILLTNDIECDILYP